MTAPNDSAPTQGRPMNETKRGASARALMLRYLGSYGPSTIAMMQRAAPIKLKAGLRQAAVLACEEGVMTRAGHDGQGVVYALTPAGVAWLDEEEALSRAEVAARKARKAAQAGGAAGVQAAE